MVLEVFYLRFYLGGGGRGVLCAAFACFLVENERRGWIDGCLGKSDPMALGVTFSFFFFFLFFLNL